MAAGLVVLHSFESGRGIKTRHVGGREVIGLLPQIEEGCAMKAVVMAGGEGSRLRPLTGTRPKPMGPIVGRPGMGHIPNLRKSYGIAEDRVTVHYIASAI